MLLQGFPVYVIIWSMHSDIMYTLESMFCVKRGGPEFILVMKAGLIYLGLMGKMFVKKLGKDWSQNV